MALIVPELYADLVREKFEGRAIMRSLSTNVGILDFQEVGSIINFPKWNTIGAPEDMTNFTMSTGTLTAEALAQTASQATVKQIGKAVYVRDLDNLTALGNHINEAASQTGIVIARKVDSDIFADALTSPLKFATAASNAITEAELNAAINEFGDDQDVDTMAGIVINSAITASLYQMPLFINNTYTTAAGQNNINGIVRGGLIGFYRSIPVYLSDKETYDSIKDEYVTLIIKNGALGYMEKRAIKVEEDRVAMRGGSNIVSNLMYATHLLMDDGVVVVRKTIV